MTDGNHLGEDDVVAGGARSRQDPVRLELRIARGFFGRLLGLYGQPVGDPQGPRALILKPCCAVHTLGLDAPIDVVFLGAENQILRHVSGLSPNRWAMDRRARAVVELPAGYCADPLWLEVLSQSLRDSKIIT
ncbi:hypothetical protein [Castellaniella sp. GW247-6E4]|uniref:hypothetical protein n=1 Tax=Castellaniella sp. GW247-6E4 TaxID=3140380 RepID=UPI00331469AB